MDLLSLVGKIWRYKFFTAPVVILTIIGAAYVMAFKQPVYTAKASVALLSPPAPPSAEDIARDPSLARVKADNPYTRFGDQSVIIGVLASSMSGDGARRAIARAGADPRYVIAPSTEFGYSSPIVQITTMSSSPEAAVQSARIVDAAVTNELDRLQASEGVDKRYRIKSLRVVQPDEAQLQASGKLRILVGVLVLGAVMLFIVISVADALATLRRESARRAGPLPLTPAPATVPDPDAPLPFRREPTRDRWDSSTPPTTRNGRELPQRNPRQASNR